MNKHPYKAGLFMVAVIGCGGGGEVESIVGIQSALTDVLIYSNGTSVSVGTRSTITGLIDGPVANVVIRSRARINGCAGAGRQLTLEPDATIASSNPNATLPMQP
jgi:hypothetical protein